MHLRSRPLSVILLQAVPLVRPAEAEVNARRVARLQVHIKHAGTAGMLFNPARLHGIAPKIQRLASREHAISLRNEHGGGSMGLAALSRPPGPGPVQVRGHPFTPPLELSATCCCTTHAGS